MLFSKKFGAIFPLVAISFGAIAAEPEPRQVVRYIGEAPQPVYVVNPRGSGGASNSNTVRTGAARNDSVYTSVPVKLDERVMYVGARYQHSFANFTSKHLTDGVYDPNDPDAKDEFSFESMAGFSVSVGGRINDNWRVEAEVGTFGKYSESHEDGSMADDPTVMQVAFSLSTPFAGLNVFYDTTPRDWGGFYFGLGIGAAFPETTLRAAGLWPTWSNEQKTSIMFSGQVGYFVPITDAWTFDIGYRLSEYTGTNHTVQWQIEGGELDGQMFDFTNKTGAVWNHSITAGLKYWF